MGGARLTMGLAFALLGVVAACGPDERERAEHDEVCGQPGPVRILALDADRPLATVHQLEHVEGRRLLRIGDLDVTDVDDDEDGFSFSPDVAGFEYWSIGSCGESPVRLQTDGRPWTRLTHWPESWFSCDPDTGEVAILDPDGGPANGVFTVHDCRYAQTPWGLVDIVPHDEDTGALVLLPYPDDPRTQSSTPQTLIASIRIRAVPPHAGPTEREVLAVHPDELFAVTPENELVHFSLLDGTATIEATNVREFQISTDREWLIWQDAAAIGEDAEWPAGAIFLRHRPSGAQSRLADAPLAATFLGSLAQAQLGIARLQLGYLYEEPERVYRLPDLESFDLPLGVLAHGSLPDGRVLVGDAFNRGNFAFVDPADGSGEVVFDALATFRIVGDGVEFLEEVFCCLEQDERAEGRLWSVALDGTSELLAPHATRQYRFLPDRRVITTIDVDERWRGDLVVVDPEDLGERTLDDRVVFIEPVIDDDTILYGISDGDRTGVWLARPAPPR